MRLELCGVRGSTPAPGAEFVRYGGHTSCVAIGHDDEAPTLLLDAGTGIRRVDALLEGQPFRGSILLGHLHWDHTQGLPFFRSAEQDGSSVDVYMPAQGDPEAVLARLMSPPFFPVAPSGLSGSWTFRALEPGVHQIEGFVVEALEIPHKGGRTYGYRVGDGHSTVAYLSDHMPLALGAGPDGLGAYHDAALRLARDCDVLIHDAQYTDAELPVRGQYGHSAAGYAVGLGVAAGARRVLLFHHDPNRTDEAVDAIHRGLGARGVQVDAASEGLVIDLPAVTSS